MRSVAKVTSGEIGRVEAERKVTSPDVMVRLSVHVLLLSVGDDTHLVCVALHLIWAVLHCTDLLFGLHRVQPCKPGEAANLTKEKKK